MAWVGDLSALFSWTPPGAAEPAITLNEGAYRVLEISGLRSLGESEANADAIVGGIGENARLSQRRGKSLAITGRIIASSLLELDDLVSDLLTAFADGKRVGRMDIAPHPDNAELSGQSPKYIEARALSCDVIDRQSTRTYTRTFVIGLRASDPRIFDSEPLAGACTVGLTNEVQSLKVAGALGPAGTRGPFLDIELPKLPKPSTLHVRNVTTGRSLTLNVPAEWDAGDLSLNFAAFRVTDGYGVDRSGLLDPADLSLWAPGETINVGDELKVEAVAQTVETVRTPGTVEDSAAVGTVAWNETEQAKVSDGTAATVSLEFGGVVSHYLVARNYGFGLPAGAVILGVEPRVARWMGKAVATISDHDLRLLKGGVVGAVNRAQAGVLWPLSPGAVAAYGGPADLFGENLSRADVNGANFGFVLAIVRSAGEKSRVGANVDVMPMAIFYAPSEPYGAVLTLSWDKAYY